MSRGISEETLREIYRRDMQNLVYPEELRGNLAEQMSRLADRPPQQKNRLASGSRRRLIGRIAGVAAALMLCVWSGNLTIKAMEGWCPEGIGYHLSNREGIRVLQVLYDLAGRNQNFPESGDNSAWEMWQAYCPQFCEQLSGQLGQASASAVLLPTYGLGEYEYMQAQDYISVKEKQAADIFLGAYMQGEKDSYGFSISKMEDAAFLRFTGMADRCYQIEVNGIFYDILHIAPEYPYEEFDAIQREVLSHEFVQTAEDGEWMQQETRLLAEPFGETWFRDWMTRPTHIMAQVNGITYEYALSDGIDVDAFLESIR